MIWGERKENGVWIAQCSRRRFMWRNHDSLYIAAGRLRVRMMKLGRRRTPTQGAENHV